LSQKNSNSQNQEKKKKKAQNRSKKSSTKKAVSRIWLIANRMVNRQVVNKAVAKIYQPH
jgi:hypothetical protein